MTLTTSRRLLAEMPLACGLALSILCSIATADEFVWNNPYVGFFDNWENWDDGSTGVPGEADIALFTGAAVYSVGFRDDHITDRVLVRGGIVTFYFEPGQDYRLLAPLSITPGITIGQGDGDVANLTLHGGALSGVFTEVGHYADAVGMLTLEGEDVLLENTQHLHVGNQGVGFLTVADAATALNGRGYLAMAGGSFAHAEITGADAQWLCDGALTVGKGGAGDMIITDGAVVTSHDATIAHMANSMGDVIVSGPDSAWLIDGTLDVGYIGFGNLRIEDGAVVTNHTFATIGTLPDDYIWYPPYDGGGYGEVVVTGSGSTWDIDGDLYVGFMSIGELLVGDDATVNVNGDLTLNSYDLFTRELMTSGGGSIAVNGDILRGDSYSMQMIVEFTASDDYPTYAIDAAGMTDDFTIEIAITEEYYPLPGDQYAMIRADGGLGLITLSLPDLPSLLQWKIDMDATQITLIVQAIGDVTGDGIIDVLDLLELLAAWGDCPSQGDCPADVDGNGVVDVLDLLIVLGAWTY